MNDNFTERVREIVRNIPKGKTMTYGEVASVAGSLVLNPAKVIIRSDAVKRNGKAALALQVFINSKRKVIPLGFDVEIKYFDKLSGKVMIRGEGERTKMLNTIIHNSSFGS